MPKIDVASVPRRKGSSYPKPFDGPCAERVRQRLGDAGGITQFGVNLLTLPPGAWSSQRHWHSSEDEFVYVLSGEVSLITGTGKEILRAGDCAALPKGDGDGHHLVNNSDGPAICLEIGTRSTNDVCLYADIDLRIDKKVGRFTRKTGESY